MKHPKGGYVLMKHHKGGYVFMKHEHKQMTVCQIFFRPQEHPTQYLPKPCGPPYASTLLNCHFWVWHYWLSNWL
jgi:hypothetical protein